MPRKHTDKQRDDICRSYPSISVKNLAITYQCSETTIRDYLKEKNIIPCKTQQQNKENLVGQIYGNLLVVRLGSPREKKYIRGGKVRTTYLTQYWCQCKCGKEGLKLCLAKSLKAGEVKSCGCLSTGPKRKLKESQRSQICKLYPKVSTKDLAEKFDCSSSTIRVVLINHGIIPKDAQDQNKENLVGQTYGNLLVVKLGPSREKKYIRGGKERTTFLTQYWCQCKCEKEGLKLCLAKSLKAGEVKSCGCLYCPDLVGKTFGKLTVIKRGPNGNSLDSRWWVQCNCGNPNLFLHYGHAMKAGSVQHCGCEVGRGESETSRLFKEARHIKKLDKLGHVRLIGDFITSHTKTDYFCLLHNERHKSTPANTGSGGGLQCCFRAAAKHRSDKSREIGVRKLISFCSENNSQIDYVDGYKNIDNLANFRCKVHNEIHPATPYAILYCDASLKCCRRGSSKGGFDTLDAALDNQLRFSDQEEWLYLYELRRFKGFVKLGIAKYIVDEESNNDKKMERQNDYEYGDEICSWYFKTRLDAFFLEESLFHKTIQYQSYPPELEGWGGYLEIRKCARNWIVDQTQFLVDYFHEVGRWQFVLDQIPLNSDQISKVNALLKSSKKMS